MANASDPQANGAQRPGRRNRRAPPSNESYEHHEDSTLSHNTSGAHSTDQVERSFSARARNQPEGNLNYTTRKPVPESASELSVESATPRGLPTDAHAPDSAAMPQIQVSSPPPAAPGRSNTTRSGSVSESRRDWASDRSPLQKLEVTLTGISKEEKRARVQQAEAKARERMARKKAQQEKAALAAAARQASAQPVESSQPSPGAAKKSGRDDAPIDREVRNGHASASQQRQPGNAAVRHNRNGSANPQYPAIRHPEDPQFAQAQSAIPSSAKMGNVPKRSVTVSGPAKPGPAHNINHSRSVSQATPRAGQVPSALRAEKPHNLSLSPSPLSPQDSAESQSKPKNVSFNVPPPTPPPIFEWRGAQPAQLRASDFDLQILDINRSKAWWEGGDNTDRRKSRALPKTYKSPAQKLTGKNSLQCLSRYLACQRPVEKFC